MKLDHPPPPLPPEPVAVLDAPAAEPLAASQLPIAPSASAPVSMPPFPGSAHPARLSAPPPLPPPSAAPAHPAGMPPLPGESSSAPPPSPSFVMSRSPYEHDGSSEYFMFHGHSRAHQLVACNLVSALASALRGRDCEIYPPGARIAHPPAGLRLFPDVVVISGRAEQPPDSNDVLNPTLLADIYSPASAWRHSPALEGHVRHKARLARLVPSVREIVLADEVRPYIELWQRQPDDAWLVREIQGIEASVTLASLDVTLPLAELYAGVLAA